MLLSKGTVSSIKRICLGSSHTITRSGRLFIIIAFNYGEHFCHVFKWCSSWEGNLLNPTSADITCSRIRTLNQNGWSWYNFSQEKTHHPLIPVIIYSYYQKYAVPLFLATLYSAESNLVQILPKCRKELSKFLESWKIMIAPMVVSILSLDTQYQSYTSLWEA